MDKACIKLVQSALAKAGHNPGTIDGALGSKTYRAADAALSKRTNDLPGDWSGWPDKRKVVAYLQLLCKDGGVEVGEIDGYWGPQTEFACESLRHIEDTGAPAANWRDDEPLSTNPRSWPTQSESELRRFYGDVGKNQTKIALPYPHLLAWDLSKTVNSYSCHEKVHDSLKRVLTQVHDHYGIDRIRALRLDHWGGCLNVRKMRGGSRYSMHSWGIAIDYDPARNKLKWKRDRANFAKPDYDAWWRFWEEEGWVSLGRSRNYDWMHVQAARL